MPVDSLLALSGTTGWRKYLTNINRAWRCAFDTATGEFKWKNASGTTITAVDNTANQTIAGNKTFTGVTTLAGVGAVLTATVVLTNAEMLALRATPKQLVAAPGAGLVNEVLGGRITIDYTAAYTESTDNIGVRYTGAAGLVASTIEATGFLDATADSMANIVPSAGPCSANAVLVLHNLGDGEWGGGNAANVITVTLFYRTVAIP